MDRGTAHLSSAGRSRSSGSPLSSTEDIIESVIVTSMERFRECLLKTFLILQISSSYLKCCSECRQKI